MRKIDTLRWIRSTSPELIPRYLLEQVKHKEYTVDDFIKYQINTAFISTDQGKVLNPFSHLYYLANEDNLIKGILWFCVDPLTKDIIIQTYSVDKEYSKEGGSVEKLCILIKDIAFKANLKKIYWVTNFPRHSQRHGFKKSKSVLMEYCMDEKKLKSDDNEVIKEN
jgi:hypothetical protein